MEPPLGSRPCPLGLVQPLRPARPGKPLFAPNRHAPLILNRPPRSTVTTFGLYAKSHFAPNGNQVCIGYAMFPRFPSPGPLWAVATPAPERFARLRRLSLGLAFVGPARLRRGRRFPSASAFGRFPPFAGERKTLTNSLTL